MGKDWYLKSLYEQLQKILRESKSCQIKGPNEPIPWSGQPKNFWPRADIVMDAFDTQIIVETDENSNPCHSIVKYWPYFDKQLSKRIILIEIWRRGSSIGQGYFELAKIVGKKFENMFPNFRYLPVERHEETPEQMASWVFAQIRNYC